MPTDSSDDSVERFLESLNNIQPEASSVSQLDSQSGQEEELFINGTNYARSTREDLRDQRYENNTQLRKRLAFWALSIVSLWLTCVILILAYNSSKYRLSDNVLIALLTTTTANILGIIYIVLKDIFNGRSED
ncbi:hypothetical protein [Sphingobacterium bambusae]|uniref:hypothetical protein n=1 Tax=Sphingobacterium bambusae TaxID=662858 RepID=UPI0036D33FCA